MQKISEIRVTRRTLVCHPNCDYVVSWYWLFQGRLYNADKTKYKRFKFVVWYENEDIQLYFDDEEPIDNGRLREYANVLAMGVLDLAEDYDNLAEFYDECVRTIEDYNAGLRREARIAC